MSKSRTELAAIWLPTFILRPAFNRHPVLDAERIHHPDGGAA
jgi:hypothetical protein